MILVPTRELALQISSTVKEIGKYLNVQCMVSTGGTNLKEDIHRLRNQTAPVHVVVGTPGRVLDLSIKNVMNLSNCENLINFNEYNLNTKKVTDISNMFFECVNIISITLSNWNT